MRVENGLIFVVLEGKKERVSKDILIVNYNSSKTVKWYIYINVGKD